MTNVSATSIGWADHEPDDPAVVELRRYLDANNGLRGLEIFDPTDVGDVARVLHRDGFVVVRDVLTPEQVEFLRAGCEEVVEEIVALDPDRLGNRGSHRYSFGEASMTGGQLHRAAWQMLIDLPTLTPLVTAIFGSPHYVVRGAGGDFCLPGAVAYQPLHSDLGDHPAGFTDRRGHLRIRDLPLPMLAVNFLTVPSTRTNGPTRQIPATQHSREVLPSLVKEPEWMRLSTVCPAPAGAVQIRDVRAWHGGTPNVSDHVRAIPNVEFLAPWFRELTVPSISHADWRKLSDHGRQITRFIVADSGDELKTGYTL